MTTRLRLRDFELGDFQAVHAFATDLAVVRYVEWGPNTPATRRLLAFGFNELGLHKISATCDPENRASVAVLTKNGMRQEGVLRDHVYAHDQWRDRLLLSAIG